MNISDIRPVGDQELLLTWEDGHRSLYSFFYLRFLCPCAGCVDEHTGRQTLQKEMISENIRTVDFTPVGLYAVKFRWNDGHQTGIYSFEYLRRICPCEICTAQSKVQELL